MKVSEDMVKIKPVKYETGERVAFYKNGNIIYGEVTSIAAIPQDFDFEYMYTISGNRWLGMFCYNVMEYDLIDIDIDKMVNL